MKIDTHVHFFSSSFDFSSFSLPSHVPPSPPIFSVSFLSSFPILYSYLLPFQNDTRNERLDGWMDGGTEGIAYPNMYVLVSE